MTRPSTAGARPERSVLMWENGRRSAQPYAIFYSTFGSRPGRSAGPLPGDAEPPRHVVGRDTSRTGDATDSAPDEIAQSLLFSGHRHDGEPVSIAQPIQIPHVQVAHRVRSDSGRRRPARRERARASTVKRTELIVPNPASATNNTRSGETARQKSRQSPSAASGDRKPPAVSTRPTSPPCQTNSSTRSPIVNQGRPRASAAIGRRHGHLVPAMRAAHDVGRLPGRIAQDRRIEASRIVVGIKGLSGLAGGHGRRRPRATAVRRCALTHVLPMSVPVPTTAMTRRGRATRVSRTPAGAGEKEVGVDEEGSDEEECVEERTSRTVGERQGDQTAPRGADRRRCPSGRPTA